MHHSNACERNFEGQRDGPLPVLKKDSGIGTSVKKYGRSRAILELSDSKMCHSSRVASLFSKMIAGNLLFIDTSSSLLRYEVVHLRQVVHTGGEAHLYCCFGYFSPFSLF